MRNTRSGRHGPQSSMENSMFEFLIGVVTHTPVWVWVLFIFLISRGLKARRPATVTLERLAIIPGIFLIWDIYDLIVYRTLTPGTVALWTAGILAGAALAIVSGGMFAGVFIGKFARYVGVYVARVPV